MRFSKFIILASVLLLSGCGKAAPNEGDVEDALNRTNSQKMEQLSALYGGQDNPQFEQIKSMMPSFTDVKINSCEKQEEREAYVCNYTVTIDAVGTKQEGVPAVHTLIKSDDGWVILNP